MLEKKKTGKVNVIHVYFFVAEGNCLQINELIVPNVVENGSKSAVVLDCDYSINNSETGLVVKWFLNDGDTPVYQWIPPQRPQDLGKLKVRELLLFYFFVRFFVPPLFHRVFIF